MRGIILAAGKGSRLNGTAGDKPKCLVEIGGVTLVEIAPARPKCN